MDTLTPPRSMAVSDRFKARRIAMGLGRVEVAREMGLSTSWVVKLEVEGYRRYSPDTVVAMASALECDPAWLFLGDV